MGTIMDLEKLTIKLVEVAKEFRRAFRKTNYLPHPSMMIKVSLAYWRIEKSLVYYSGIGRLMRPCSLALFRMD
jgi:hypothetical protein